MRGFQQMIDKTLVAGELHKRKLISGELNRRKDIDPTSYELGYYEGVLTCLREIKEEVAKQIHLWS